MAAPGPTNSPMPIKAPVTPNSLTRVRRSSANMKCARMATINGPEAWIIALEAVEICVSAKAVRILGNQPFRLPIIRKIFHSFG